MTVRANGLVDLDDDEAEDLRSEKRVRDRFLYGPCRCGYPGCRGPQECAYAEESDEC